MSDSALDSVLAASPRSVGALLDECLATALSRREWCENRRDMFREELDKAENATADNEAWIAELQREIASRS